MYFLYIEGYLKVEKEIKIKFFKYLNDFEEIKISTQKFVLEDKSLLLELYEDTNIKFATEKTKLFFKNNSLVNVKGINKILNGGDSLILVFDDDILKRINK